MTFLKNNSFPTWFCREEYQEASCKGQSQGQGSRTLLFPLTVQRAQHCLFCFIHWGSTGDLVRARIIQSYNLLIYIYTTNLEVRRSVSTPLVLPQRSKGLGHYLRLILLYLWVYNLIWLPCSGGKEKVRNTAVGLVLAGKWDFSPLPNPVGFLFLILGWVGGLFVFFEIHKRTMWEFASLLYIKRLNISELMVPNCALVPLTYLHDPWIPHGILIYFIYLSQNTSWLHGERRPPNRLKSGFQ